MLTLLYLIFNVEVRYVCDDESRVQKIIIVVVKIDGHVSEGPFHF